MTNQSELVDCYLTHQQSASPQPTVGSSSAASSSPDRTRITSDQHDVAGTELSEGSDNEIVCGTKSVHVVERLSPATKTGGGNVREQTGVIGEVRHRHFRSTSLRLQTDKAIEGELVQASGSDADDTHSLPAAMLQDGGRGNQSQLSDGAKELTDSHGGFGTGSPTQDDQKDPQDFGSSGKPIQGPSRLAIDPVGDTKISPTGHLLGGRQFRCPIFALPQYDQHTFVLARDAARITGYRDAFQFARGNKVVRKV